MASPLTNNFLATLSQTVEAARANGIASVPVRVSVLAALLDRHGEDAEEEAERAAAPKCPRCGSLLSAVTWECVRGPYCHKAKPVSSAA